MEKKFELKKVVRNRVEIDCKYIMTETNDDGIRTIKENHVKDSRAIHDDLKALFDKLKPIVAGIFRWECLDDVEVAGFALAGKNDNIGVTILGQYMTTHGEAKFKSPRIKYAVGESPECADLTVIINDFVREMELYLFHDKTAEMGTFGE
jgi:hypothetical protein